MANQPKKYKKFVATAATATLVASAIVPVASAASLSDITGNTHEEAINALVDAKVISGYPDGTFKPNKTLTRSDVVKLLGKYLVSQGHSIPTDAVSNPRFNDLTSKSNKELLEYAAVVADAGVFAGSNGKLLAGDQITRENMAIVLVRMINTLKDVSLEEFVASQNFNGDVKDLNVAKAEARTAIQVLDFYDITNPSVANFNPKGNTTRGQFATFLHKTINSDFSGAAATTGTVKAINNTTVEVTFGEEVADIKALDFKIEGLEVSNAVVKQTDKKTVVLTTAAQKAGTEYTVTVNGDAVGKFTGVSAVIPTKVELVSSSVQGKLGQQVTVQAKVTVAEGQSAAGIPVTLNATSTNGTLNAPQVVEATTDANGVATYTYTRYAAGNDTVVAYATGDRSKFSTGYVFWGVDTIVSIEEVTKGDTINNGANKTYKVTYKNEVTGKPQAGVTLNVSALENINVTADKAQNVTVNGVTVAQFSNNTVTRAAQIVTDAKGEATFTVSGNHATVTPVVFAATPQYNAGGTLSGYSQAYAASALQATAGKVTFAAVQSAYTLEMTREGGEIAARGASNGGREYKIVVKDKDGKLAANEVVNVALNEDVDKVIATQTDAAFIDDSGATQVFFTGAKAKQIAVKTNSKGEATFVVGSDKLNDYVTPIAWIDINTSNATDAKLDNGEPTATGQITHFQDQYVDGAALTSYNGTTKTSKFEGNQTAEFKLALTNQSGLPYTGSTTTITNATYTVTNTGAEEVKVNDNGTWKTVSPNRSITVSQTSNLLVTPNVDSTTSIKVTATGNASYTEAGVAKTFAFTAKEATATFTKVSEVPTTGFTGVVTAFDTTKKTITFGSKDPVKYAGEAGKTYVFKGQGNTTIADAAAFLTIVKNAEVTVTYAVDGDTVTFTVININNAGSGATDTADQTAQADLAAVATAKSKVSATPTVSVLTGATPTDKLNAVKAHVVTEVNDSTVTVDVVEITPAGTYTVTLSKGAAKDTKTVTATFATSKIPASQITAPITVDGTDLNLTFSSAIAGFALDTTSISATGATSALVNVTANGLVVDIAKASGALTDAAALRSTVLEFDIDVNATGYEATTFTVEVFINSAGERTVTLTQTP